MVVMGGVLSPLSPHSLLGTPGSLIPEQGPGAASRQGRPGERLAPLGDGTSRWGDPLNETPFSPVRQGWASASARFPPRPGGVASEQQTSSSARAREGEAEFLPQLAVGLQPLTKFSGTYDDQSHGKAAESGKLYP